MLTQGCHAISVTLFHTLDTYLERNITFEAQLKLAL